MYICNVNGDKLSLSRGWRGAGEINPRIMYALVYLKLNDITYLIGVEKKQLHRPNYSFLHISQDIPTYITCFCSIFCCLPISIVSGKRALCKLNTVKNRLRTEQVCQMTFCLSAPLLLASEKDIFTGFL